MSVRFSVLGRKNLSFEGASCENGREGENYRAIAVSRVPLGALQVIRGRRFFEIVAGIERPIFRFAALWTPSAVRYAAGNRPIQRSAVRARLPA